jgi:hypothetical protein
MPRVRRKWQDYGPPHLSRCLPTSGPVELSLPSSFIPTGQWTIKSGPP